MDARLEGVVKRLNQYVREKESALKAAAGKTATGFSLGVLSSYLDSVRGQEENALKVLELPQEDADKGIPVNVVHVSLLKEYIGLVEEQDGAPRVTDVENLLQLAFEIPGIGPQFAS